MRFWRRSLFYWRSRRIRRQLRKNPEALREFVYLDEVSVYSLLASRSGAIASEITEKRARLLRGEASGSGEFKHGTGKRSAGIKLEASRSQETEVVRQAIVQSTFRDLRSGLDRHVLFSPKEGAENEIPRRSGRGLQEWFADASLGGLAYNSAALERGKLVELRATLEADDLFRAGAVIDVFSGLINEIPESMRGRFSGLEEVFAMGRLLEMLLTGLVPLRCRATDYQWVSIDGEEWIVHNKVIDEANISDTANPVYFVGVTEQALYWKDLRRVLFSNLPVHVMGRIAKPGVRDSWSPIKLSDVVSRLVPDFATQMNNLNELMRAPMLSGGVASSPDSLFEEEIIRYSEALVTESSSSLSPTQHDRLKSFARSKRSAGNQGFDMQVEALKSVPAFLNDSFSIPPISADQTRMLRREAMDRFASALSATSRASNQESGVDVHARYLDCEVVAIYW